MFQSYYGPYVSCVLSYAFGKAIMDSLTTLELLQRLIGSERELVPVYIR